MLLKCLRHFWVHLLYLIHCRLMNLNQLIWLLTFKNFEIFQHFFISNLGQIWHTILMNHAKCFMANVPCQSITDILNKYLQWQSLIIDLLIVHSLHRLKKCRRDVHKPHLFPPSWLPIPNCHIRNFLEKRYQKTMIRMMAQFIKSLLSKTKIE